MQQVQQYIQFYSHIVAQVSCLSVAGLLAKTMNVHAQITPDTTLPASTIINTVGTNAQITGGTKFGVNLFHSFVEFSIDGTNITSANFINPGVTNIISRVTGGVGSNINGVISAANANLFLINPSGIIFGSKAQLNIGGSFVATTADSLKFQDAPEFSATNPAPPLLTMNVPVGLQFGSKPGSIIVQGIGQTQGFATQIFDNSLNPLQVSPNQTLALIGGNVQVNGGILQAPGGKVELAGVGSGGEIGLNSDFSLNLPDDLPRDDVSLSNGSAINALNSVTGDGGSISIYGQNINLDGGSLLSTGVAENLGISNGEAGDITLNAAGTVAIESSRIENNVNPGAAGDGGDINIGSGALFLTNSELDVGLFGGGNAGNILIGVLGDISLENSQLFSDVVGGNGGAGDIYILAGGRINIADTLLSSDAFSPGVAGNAGYIAILAPNDSIAIRNSTISTQSDGENSTETNIRNKFTTTSTLPGMIWIFGKTISILSNSELNASAGSGYAGGINLFAHDTVEIADSKIASDALSADQQSGGYSGFVGIGAGDSVSINNSTITAESFGSTSGNKLNSGFIFIIGGAIASNGSKISTSIANGGIAGSVFLIADDKLILSNSNIQSNSQSSNPQRSGDAGDIAVNARLVDLNQGKLEASSASGNGGGITFKVQDLVVLRNNSLIATNAGSQGNPGSGGIINIDPLFVVGVNNSDITANSFNGAGGEITITATEGIFGLKVRSQLTPLNDITAFSQTNPQLNGTIEVFSPDVDPSTGLTTLSANFVDASRLVAQDICKPKQQQSAFTITGRGGLPPNPYEIIAPDTTSVEWATRESENQRSTGVPPVMLNTDQQLPTKTKQIVEAQGLTIAPDGTVILTANPSTITPHGSGFTSPGCQ